MRYITAYNKAIGNAVWNIFTNHFGGLISVVPHNIPERVGKLYVHTYNKKANSSTRRTEDIILICEECYKEIVFKCDAEDDHYITCCGVMVNKFNIRMNEDIFD